MGHLFSTLNFFIFKLIWYGLKLVLVISYSMTDLLTMPTGTENLEEPCAAQSTQEPTPALLMFHLPLSKGLGHCCVIYQKLDHNGHNPNSVAEKRLSPINPQLVAYIETLLEQVIFNE